MSRYSVPIYRFALFLTVAVFIFSTLQPVYAAEKYERKSISFINEILLTPRAEKMPGNRVSELVREIRRQIEDEMPRFDYNDLPDSFLEQFRQRAYGYLSQRLQSVDSLNISISETEQSMAAVSRRVLSAESSGMEDRYWAEHRELSKRRSDLLKRRRAEEDALFGQVAELLTETVAPGLVRVLSDPELQRFRAQEYVDEVERNSFIVRKANELGITSEDLEKVMNSAYLYVVLLTDYARVSREQEPPPGKAHGKQRRVERMVNYSLSGGIIWFKLDMSTDEPRIQAMKMIHTDASASGTLGMPALGSELDSDTYAFRQAAKKLAANLWVETCKIEDFTTTAVIIEAIGSEVGFPLGTREGVYIDQKFSVYEKRKMGDKTEKKKRGFLYVYEVGDNVSETGRLSYGKLVVPGAEPGMQVREYPTLGLDVSFRLRTGRIKVATENLSASKARSSDTAKDASTWLWALNCTLQYDIGRTLKIPQSFITLGADLGYPSVHNPNEMEPDELYIDVDSYNAAYAGFLKKVYLGRIALLLEPLVQFQWLNIDCSDGTNFENTALSLSPNLGLEFAVQEDINAGFVLNLRLLTFGGDAANLPRILLGFYGSYCVPRLW